MRYYFERHFLTKQHKSRKVKSDPRSRIIYMKRNGTAIYGVKKGNKCRFARHPGRNRQKERYLPAHISESVKATRHPGGHVSLAADATRPSLETTRGILERERACLYFPTVSSLYVCVYVCIRAYIVVSCHTHASTQKSVARPGTSERRRRLYDGCVGFDVT